MYCLYLQQVLFPEDISLEANKFRISMRTYYVRSETKFRFLSISHYLTHIIGKTTHKHLVNLSSHHCSTIISTFKSLKSMSDFTSLEFDSSTLENISNGIVGDTSIDSLLDKNLLMGEDSDDMLQAFDDILFKDDNDNLELDISEDDFISDNVLRKKESFENFSDLLTELEEEGEDLNPISIGSEMDEFVQSIIRVTTHVPAIDHQLSYQDYPVSTINSHGHGMIQLQDMNPQIINPLSRMYPRRSSLPTMRTYQQRFNPSSMPTSLKNALQKQRLSTNALALPQSQQIKSAPAAAPQKEAKKPTKPAKPLALIKYHDLSKLTDEEVAKKCNYESMRGRTQEPFPVKLHLIIEQSEDDGYSSIISWSSHGRSFKIHNEVLFVEKVLPLYFFQSKMSSFTRQLRMYGFHKIKNKYNVDKGCFFHELFLRGRPGLACGISRSSSLRAASRKSEPNFHDFCPMPLQSSKSSITNEDNDTASTDNKEMASNEKNPYLLRVIHYTPRSETEPSSSSSCSLTNQGDSTSTAKSRHISFQLSENANSAKYQKKRSIDQQQLFTFSQQ